MKYAVLGASGQLGSALCSRLQGEVVQLGREQADLTRPESVYHALMAARPDVVINCAAYNSVDRAESEPETAFAVNAWGVRTLAWLCRELNCLFVHFSTNYVFGLDEERRTPYRESDLPAPLSVYGLSKLTGEFWARALAPRHVVIRTAAVFGRRSSGTDSNFVQTMLQRGAEGKPLRVVDDQTCTPTSTVDLADATIRIVETGRPGLYHFTNAGSCTWFEFAQTIFSLAGVEADLQAVTSEAFGAAARRPRYSVLEPAAYLALGLPAPRDWRAALQEYLQDRNK